MGLPSYKDIVDLLKKGATIEAQEKLMELRKYALELQEENINLKNQILEIKKKFRKLESFKGGPCPKCQKTTWIVESSMPDDEFGDRGGVRREYKCQGCNFTEFVLIPPK